MSSNVSPTGLARDLKKRAETGKPIRIGLVGSGEMAIDIVTQVAHMPGLEIAELRARQDKLVHAN
jgi:predicted homoserine dehydrogenase-like protein